MTERKNPKGEDTRPVRPGTDDDVRAGEVTLRRAAVRSVTADEVEIGQGGALRVQAEDVQVTQGGIALAGTKQLRVTAGAVGAVITGEAVTDGHPARPWATARFATLRDEVADALVAWHPEVDRDLAYQGAAAILGVMDGIQIQWLLDPDAVDLAETTAFAIEAIVAATIAGPKRQQPVPPPSA